MTETVTLRVNACSITVPVGTTVAAAILSTGEPRFRRSVTGELRGPVCGMGICFECRVTVDGCKQVRSCLLLCRSGMEVWTDD